MGSGGYGHFSLTHAEEVTKMPGCWQYLFGSSQNPCLGGGNPIGNPLNLLESLQVLLIELLRTRWIRWSQKSRMLAPVVAT